MPLIFFLPIHSPPQAISQNFRKITLPQRIASQGRIGKGFQNLFNSLRGAISPNLSGKSGETHLKTIAPLIRFPTLKNRRNYSSFFFIKFDQEFRKPDLLNNLLQKCPRNREVISEFLKRESGHFPLFFEFLIDQKIKIF